MRIVSLLPAATEIVAGLGAIDQLVGVTHECDWPAAVRALPRVTSSAVQAQASAGAVDAQVREVAAEGGSLFTLDDARIRSLAPELILTQQLCDVCAVSETVVRALARTLPGPPRVITLNATRFDVVLDDIAVVAAAIGASDEADELVAGLRARLRHVHDTLRAARAPRPRVAVIEWTAPIYAAGHWVPEMVRRAGGTDVLARPGAHSVTVTPDAVRAADPDVLFVSPCGYDAARAYDEAGALLTRDEWAWARGRAVWALDANGLVSRPGPRLATGVEAMAAAMHPALFPPQLPGQARRLAT
ncbi:MAG: ABC transporter substrate-binding protein [Gemmatimonadetes bacterium]|nr:ABC transporter substrate-binding protein [Gemmatimonadota bacterium]